MNHVSLRLPKTAGPRHLVVVWLCAALAACTRAPEAAVRVVPQEGPRQPRRVEFSPGDATRLLVVEASGRVGVWDLERPSEPALFASIAAGAIDAAFAPDGRSLLSAGFDGRVRRWTIDGRLVWVSEQGHGGPARAVAEGGALVVSGGDDGMVRLWTADGAPLGPPLGGHATSVLSLAVSTGGEIVSVAGDGTLRLWRRDEGASSDQPTFRSSILFRKADPLDPQTQLHLLKYDLTWGWQRAAVFASDGALIGGALFDGSVRLWNADGTPRAEIPNAHSRRPVGAIALSPRGDLLASAGFDGCVRLWNRDGSAHGAPIAAHVNVAFSVAFSADGQHLVTAGADDRVRLWNVDGSAFAELPVGRSTPPAALAVAPARPMLAVAGPDGIRVWNLDGTPHGSVTGEAAAHSASLAFSPQADLLASGGLGNVRVWNTDGTARGEPFNGNRFPVAALAFAPTAGYLAAASDALRVFTADALRWQAPAVAPDSLTAVAFSPHGEQIASGSLLGRIQVWTSDGSPRMAPLKLPKEHIVALTFVDAGRAFATAGGGEDVVRLWHLDGSVLAAPLAGHLGVVTALASSADASILASGSADGTVRVWNVASRRAEAVDVGLPVDQVGFWRDVLWVRAGGTSLFFYDRRRRLAATAVLRDGGPLIFTPDGWFTGPRPAPGSLLVFSSSGERLADESAARHFSPERVSAALSRASE